MLPAAFVAGGFTELAAQRATFAVAGAMGVAGALAAFAGLAPRLPSPANARQRRRLYHSPGARQRANVPTC